MPALASEVVDLLKIKPGQKVIDATLGGGGHSRLFAEKGAQVLGIDVDSDAIEFAKTWLADYPSVLLTKGSYIDLGAIAEKAGFKPVDAVLFDLGVSSWQFDTKERGFSFLYDAPLDMRMDKGFGVTAQELLAALSEKQLTKLFFEYGEEPKAKRIAQAIVERRQKDPVTSTKQLAELIERVVGPKKGKLHPATRVFQALRIAVNTELDNLEEVLPQALAVLANRSRVGVISFHSLEDRIVKQTFKKWQDQGLGQIITHKPVQATEQEVDKNPRSRSAKLRVFEKNETI